MIISEKQIQQQSQMVHMIKDKNFVFLELIDRNTLQMQYFNQKERVTYWIQLLQKLNQLDFHEIIQWTSVFYIKVRNLLRRSELIRLMQTVSLRGRMSQSEAKVFSSFRQSVRLLVKVCNLYEVDYEQSSVQTMLKKFYYSEYGDRVVQYFISADYDCQDYWPLPPRKKPIPIECCKTQESDGQSL